MHPTDRLSRPAPAKLRRSSGLSRSRQRDRIYQYLRDYPLDDISAEEVDAHFQGMPARYWEQATKNDVIWGLETIHAFFGKLAASPGADACVGVNWRHCPERGFTKVMVCTWDRPGLLAKIAAAFSVLRINILRAEVFTRADNVVLDVFHVCDLDQLHVSDSARLHHLIFLLEGALNDPPRFVSLWATQYHRVLNPVPDSAPRVEFDNDASPDYTVITIESADRLGLLYDILQVLSDAGLNITQAIVETDDELARDLFHVTDLEGQKLLVPERLAQIRLALVKGI